MADCWCLIDFWLKRFGLFGNGLHSDDLWVMSSGMNCCLDMAGVVSSGVG